MKIYLWQRGGRGGPVHPPEGPDVILSMSPPKVKYCVQSGRHNGSYWLWKVSLSLSLLMVRPKCCLTLPAIRNLQRICHWAWNRLIPPPPPPPPPALQPTLFQTLHYWWVARQWIFKHFTDSIPWQGLFLFLSFALSFFFFCLVPAAGWKQMEERPRKNVIQYLNYREHLPHNLSERLRSAICKEISTTAAADLSKHNI